MKDLIPDSPPSWHSRTVVVTGASGSGKSLVAQLLRELGAAVISADELAREALSPGSPSLLQVRKTFGDELFKGDILDRKALGRLVFSHPKLREQLEAIVHPRVAELAQQRFNEYSLNSPTLVIYDCPLFFETGLRNQPFKSVVLVTAPEETKIRRLMERDGLSREDALSRLANQLSDGEKIPHSDHVIVNDKSVTELKQQVQALYQELIRS